MIPTHTEWSDMMLAEHGPACVAAWDQRTRLVTSDMRAVALARLGAGDSPSAACYAAVVWALGHLIGVDGLDPVVTMFDDVRAAAIASRQWEFNR